MIRIGTKMPVGQMPDREIFDLRNNKKPVRVRFDFREIVQKDEDGNDHIMWEYAYMTNPGELSTIKQWQPEEVITDKDRVREYEEKLFFCIQPHTTQTGWEPYKTPALWKRHYSEDESPSWKQPQGAHDAYPKGAIVEKNGTLYKSNIDHNVWEPGTVNTWIIHKEIQSTDPQPWKQPQGAHDAYQKGANVTHNGKTWENTINDNVWEPGVYGWIII